MVNHVSNILVLAAKRFCTELTPVQLCPGVPAFVQVDVTPLSCSVRAKAALEGLLTSVRPLVNFNHVPKLARVRTVRATELALSLCNTLKFI